MFSIPLPTLGSMTLHQWQRLATPNLGGFLDDRHGVHFKGQRELPVEDDLYDLSDYEEDGKTVTATWMENENCGVKKEITTTELWQEREKENTSCLPKTMEANGNVQKCL